MIKKYIINKITVTTMCVILLLMFYLIPVNNNYESNIKEEDKNKYENIIYLLDEDNFVSKVISYYDKNTLEEVIKEKLNILTYGLAGNNNFYSLIPKNTKVNKIKIDKNNLYIDFSKEVYDVSKYLEEEMIESIVYTLSEINGIDNIYLTVNGKELSFEDKLYEYPLTRKIGINKEYDIDNFNDINKTTIVFSKEYNNEKYYVPVTKINNNMDDKINIIIEELKSGIYSQDNLYGYINEKVSVEDYNIKDDKITLVFNEYIFDREDIILDEVKNTISESIFENYDVKEVIFSTKDNKNLCNIVKK